MSPKKKKESEKNVDDLELEISDDELKKVSGGLGLRVRKTKRALRGGRRLGRRDNPIGSLARTPPLKRKP